LWGKIGGAWGEENITGFCGVFDRLSAIFDGFFCFEILHTGVDHGVIGLLDNA
jgi:hypothetical protein